MVVEEKAPQPQSHQPRWGVEMGSLGLWGVGMSLQGWQCPYSSIPLPPSLGGSLHQRGQETKGCSGGLGRQNGSYGTEGVPSQHTRPLWHSKAPARSMASGQ